jgi:uncharacterized membrane protein (UPF0127 family)
MIAQLRNLSQTKSPHFELEYCATFWTKLMGLMFRKSLEPFAGVLLVETQDGVINTTIHMLFMNFDICTVWIDSTGVVVDVQLAKRWHLMYKPRKAACLVLETHVRHFGDFQIGDKIEYEII